MREGPQSPRAEVAWFLQPRAIYGFVFILWLLGLVNRIWFEKIPADFSAYLSAADVFVNGENPFTEQRENSARYQGYVYNYFPGTLFLISPLAWISTQTALVLDWTARFVVLAWSLTFLQRKLLPEVPLQFCILIALVHQPLLIDCYNGNITTYLLGAVVACVYLGDCPRSARSVLLAVVCGVVLHFKPFWFLPAGYALIVSRSWVYLAATLMAALLMISLSGLLPHFIEPWFNHNQELRAFYNSVDLLSIAPLLLGPAMVLGVCGALLLHFRRPNPMNWLWGCLSMPIWPRLASYSYILTLPFVFYCIRRWGFRKALIFNCVWLGPLPWLIREPSLVPDSRVEGWVFFVWAVASAGVLFRDLWTNNRPGAVGDRAHDQS
jgi:hypothetical protein